MRRRDLVSVSLLAVGLLATRVPALAQDDANSSPPQAAPAASTDRLTVRTHARATAKADEIELELVVEASSEDAKDAEKKHRDKLSKVLGALTGRDTAKDSDKDGKSSDDDSDSKPKKRRKKAKAQDDDDDTPAPKDGGERTSDALPRVGVPDADGVVYEVREGRSTVGIQGNPAEQQEDPNAEKRSEGEIRVGTAVHVSFKNIAKLPAKQLHRLIVAVIDRAADAGADMGAGKTSVKPAIRFRSSDTEALKRKAYADAVSKGRARAEELARLANRKLGKLSCVTELDPPPASQNQATEGWNAFVGQLGTGDPDDGSSSSSEVVVDVQVQLDFELK